ncbi:glycosyl transferase [Limisphaera sp. 4302-co]|uniref:glycosyl transferase n=1 Tax=Limisphaera sp. 4302-co TaxID=3400417 RepID=UPI003C255116
MADFFQTGAIATLHRLGTQDLGRLERELMEFVHETPIGLVLPCHVRELGTRALRLIARELREVPYLRQIIVGLDGATRSRDFQRARRFFAGLPQRPVVVWNDGPRLSALYRKLEENDLYPGPSGKGRNVWMCFGYVLASEQVRMVAMHDCDILTYSRELLARLCYPVAHPSLGFDFCKGYYARVTDRLNGRVMRLLMTPLIRALKSILGAHPFLVYLDTFRYPLAGEVSLDVDLVRRLRIPHDWALEIGMLAEVYRNCSPRAICQSELCENYDHKHRELSPRDPEKGLNRMAVDIVKSLLLRMAAEGIKLDTGLFDSLLACYSRQAEDTLRFYAADAAINGLYYARHEEESAVATFVRSIRAACRAYQEDPLSSPLIPNWNRVESALPNFLEELRRAVHADNEIEEP